jgi:hypothetical protein
MPFTLKQAGQFQPTVLRNEIVSSIDQAGRRSGEGVVNTTDVFPMKALQSSTETYFRRHGGVGGMRQTALDAESPVVDMESMSQTEITVEPYKAKYSPDKGVNTDLNTPREIANVFEMAVEELQSRLMIARDMVSWRGDGNVDGMIGQDGVSAHPDLRSDHVVTPSTPFSDQTNSTPQAEFMNAELLIDEDGSALDQAGPMTAYMTPSTLYDLKLNADLSDRFTGVETQGLTMDQVANILPFEQVRKVRLQVRRTDDNGQYLDDSGAVATTEEDIAYDNILEPYDSANDTNRRNIVIGAPGEVSASIPFFVDRLAEMASNAEPSGQFAVDSTEGFVVQSWTDHDPAISWFKTMQEIGFELLRPDNWFVLQDV